MREKKGYAKKICAAVVAVMIVCVFCCGNVLASSGGIAFHNPGVHAYETTDENGDAVIYVEATQIGKKGKYGKIIFSRILCLETDLSVSLYTGTSTLMNEYPERVVSYYEEEFYLKPQRNASYRFAICYTTDEYPDVERTYYGSYVYHTDITSLPEYYDNDGAEVSVRKDGGVLYAEIDCTADKEGKLYAALYDEDGAMLEVREVSGEVEKSAVGEKVRFCGTVEFAESGADYVKLYTWDNGLAPLLKAESAAADEAEITLTEVDGAAEIEESGEYEDMKIYGPLLAYSEETENVRYFKECEKEITAEDGKITLENKGRYMVVCTDKRGVEHRRFIDVGES